MSQRVIYMIYGMHSRDATIDHLKSILPISEVVYDDRSNGGSPLYTCRKAWEAALKYDADWICMLQDDVEPCNNFCSHVQTIANQFAGQNVLLTFFDFLFFNVEDKCTVTKHWGTPYVDVNFACGPCIMMPKSLIKDCFDWIWTTYDISAEKLANRKTPDDLYISDYFKKHEYKIIKTMPSIVQHIGDDSSLYLQHKRISHNFILDPRVNWQTSKIHHLTVDDRIKYNKWLNWQKLVNKNRIK